jgi:predicted AlkP superfamily pyrophosphatase or phosphodiesterase
VIGLVVDQMRWDYLYRYADRYGEGGFKRLMTKGFNCQNTTINYLPTFTAPGHACVYTGSVPALHGIASNDWYDNLDNKAVYCTEDPGVDGVACEGRVGQMSPKNLKATTITDELRLATNFNSRVYGISIKDRGAILPAGHLGNGAFWYDDKDGAFVSSSYYGKELPKWLSKFNDEKNALKYLQQGWETLYPLNTYSQSLQDNNIYEGSLRTEASPVFPHLKENKATDLYLLRFLPQGNTLVFDAGKACIEGEQLGTKGYTDFLCLSLSSTDYAGHMFGPNSIEIEDMYLRLDKDLEAFLLYLDTKLGKDGYTLFLTADHGGAHNAKFMKDKGIPAGNASETEVKKALNEHLKGQFWKDSIVGDVGNYQVYLNDPLIEKEMLNREEIKKVIARWFRKLDGVAYVIDMETMEVATLPEPVKTMVINGYNARRSGSIQIITEPGWYSGSAPTGTTHGSWNPYDSHIPLLWYGYGITPGQTYRTVNMTDIAPTLAALLRIQMPNACVGQVIGEIVK